MIIKKLILFGLVIFVASCDKNPIVEYDTNNCNQPNDSDSFTPSECDCDSIPDGDCDCNGNSYDCQGICGGSAIIDECGICDGNGQYLCWNDSEVCDTSACPLYFNVTINETGESTLFIFQNSISILESGDELGLFDLSGVIDSDGNVGEVLVGAGKWEDSQLEIVAIASQDLSSFGGPTYPGSANNNIIKIKIWDQSEQILHDNISYVIEQGNATFNGLFTAFSELTIQE